MPRQLSLDETAAPLVPERPSLPKLKEAAAGCTACPLHETGTQTVFGEGTSKADVVFVGEQPGDQEDRLGHPFVGPAIAITIGGAASALAGAAALVWARRLPAGTGRVTPGRAAVGVEVASATLTRVGHG